MRSKTAEAVLRDPRAPRSAPGKVGAQMRPFRVIALSIGCVIALSAAVATPLAAESSQSSNGSSHTVNIPETDKFVPFALTVQVGDRVRWVNSDTDDHTVVSDDAFNTAGHLGLNVLIPGTD